MHGQALLEFARLLGLSQYAIARHFGINRSQVHRWAQGERPIPTERLEPLLQLVHDAAQRYLDSGQADLWHVEPAEPPYDRGLAGVECLPPLRPQIEQLLHELTMENLELRGLGPSATIKELGAALEPYFAMDQATLRKPANARELKRLSAHLSAYATVLVALEPLLGLSIPALPQGYPQEETTHADLD